MVLLGGLLGLFLGTSWSLFGFSCGPVGVSCKPLGDLLSFLGASWRPLGASWGALGCSFDTVLALLGAVLKPLRAILEALGPILGHLAGRRAILCRFGASWKAKNVKFPDSLFNDVWKITLLNENDHPGWPWGLLGVVLGLSIDFGRPPGKVPRFKESAGRRTPSISRPRPNSPKLLAKANSDCTTAKVI